MSAAAEAPGAGAPRPDAPPGSLTFRADATARQGTGHVMRCLGLAEAWRDAGGTARFAAAAIGDGLADLVRSRGFEVVSVTEEPGSPADAEAAAGLAAGAGGWLALDGYRFDAAYKRRAGERAPLLLVDDFAADGYDAARLILNQTLHADAAAYPRAAPGALLLGPAYTILRREFRPYRGDVRPSSGEVRQVLVTLGGSDPDHAAGAVLDAFSRLSEKAPRPAIVLVIGAMSPHADRVRAAAAALSERPDGFDVTVKTAVADMAAEIAGADFAVTAGGLTLQELAFLGVPAAVVRTAGNQAPGVTAAVRAGFAVDFGRHPGLDGGALTAGLADLLTDRDRLAAMSAAGRATVDGRGADRVVAAVRALTNPLALRPATWADSARLLAWRNDPATRQASRNTAAVAVEEHERWLRGLLADASRTLWIAEERGTPVGSVRVDPCAGSRGGGEPGERELSWTVAPEARGRGVAKRMVTLAADRLTGVLRAAVRCDNPASARVAESVGLRPAGDAGDGFRLYRRPARAAPPAHEHTPND